MRLTHRQVELVAQGYPAKKKQSWEVKPAIWWQLSRYLGGRQPEPQIQQPSLRLLSPCLGSHCHLLAELSTAPCWTFFYVNHTPEYCPLLLVLKLSTQMPASSLVWLAMGTDESFVTLPQSGHRGLLKGTQENSGPCLIRPIIERSPAW